MVKRRGGLREGFGLVLGFSAAGLSGCSDMGGKSPYPEVEQYLKNRYGGRFEIEEAAGNKIFLRLDMDVENLGTEKRPFLYSWHLRQERKAGFSGLSRRSL